MVNTRGMIMRRNSGSGSPKKRMLDQSEIDTALAEVAEQAAVHGVHLVLVGGAALQFYGSDRFTADVDFAADRAVPGLAPEKRLTFGGYAAHTASGVPIDIILRDDDYADVFAEAITYGVRVADSPVLLISPEYAIVLKMIARRPKDEADIAALLLSDVLDRAKARKLVKRLLGPYAAQDFDQYAREADWQAADSKQ